jgi:hypothetical protein
MNNNKHKREVLEAIDGLLQNVCDKLYILDALDKDKSDSGCYDLHDQLNDLFTSHNALARCVERSMLVVPRAWNSDII